MEARSILCRDCGVAVIIPDTLPRVSNPSRTSPEYKYLRSQGWTIDEHLRWNCPLCVTQQTSAATRANPGRLHEQDWNINKKP